MRKISKGRLAAIVVAATWLASVSGTLGAPAPAKSSPAEGATPVTPEVVLSFHIGDRNAYFSAINISPAWMPDSRRIVYSRPDLARPGRLGIEIFDTKMGRTVRLGEGSDPRPSPDGKTLAFLRGKGPQRQIWLMGTDGKNPRALTRHADGLGGWSFNLAWSPDGNEIAYCYTPESTGEKSKKLKEQEKREKEGKSSVVVYGSAQDLPPDSEIWLMDVAKGTERKVASYATMLFELSWFPDGRRLLVYGFRHGASYRESKDESDVIVVDSRTGERQNIVQAGGEGLVGRVSPDGSRIAFFYDADDVRYPDMYTVAVVAPQGGPARSLTPKLVTSGRPIWSPDGSRIYYIAHAGAFSQIFAVSPDGGDAGSLTASAAMHRNVAVSPDGNLLAWFEEAADGRARAVYARADGSDPRTVANLTPQYDRLELGEAKEVRWKSRDGLEIAGILVLPPGAPPGKPLPLVVELHGGPVGGLSVTGQLICIGPLERQIWAAKGYAVFAPDYRTSGVYGWDQILAGRKNQDFMDRDFDDITSGVDDLVRSGIADPDRMVVGGHSYGGVQTEWIITHSHAFKAAGGLRGSPRLVSGVRRHVQRRREHDTRVAVPRPAVGGPGELLQELGSLHGQGRHDPDDVHRRGRARLRRYVLEPLRIHVLGAQAAGGRDPDAALQEGGARRLQARERPRLDRAHREVVRRSLEARGRGELRPMKRRRAISNEGWARDLGTAARDARPAAR
jgi:dipeptidyl aminopeptidase/acylaminoacyl peptidase